MSRIFFVADRGQGFSHGIAGTCCSLLLLRPAAVGPGFSNVRCSSTVSRMALAVAAVCFLRAEGASVAGREVNGSGVIGAGCSRDGLGPVHWSLVDLVEMGV